MRVPIDEVVTFDVVTSSPITGNASDADSTPTFEVFEDTTDTDIGVGGNLTKRTSKTGDYRGSFTASAANGFEAGKWYSVIASATVGGVSGKARAMHFMCVPAEAVAGVPKVDQHALRGDTQSSIDLKDFADDGYDPSTNKVQGVVLTDTVTTYTGNTPQTGDAYARIGANGAGLSAIPWNAAWDAEVQSEVDDALIAKGLDHLVFTSVTGTDVADNSIIAKIVSKSSTADWDTFVNTTDALEGIRDNMGTAQTGDAYAIVNSGTHGNAALKSLIDVIDGIVDAILVDTGTTLDGRLPAALVSGRMDCNMQAVADGVLTAQKFAANFLTAAKIHSDVGEELAAALLDLADGIETGFTLREFLKLTAAVLLGKVSGAPTSPVFRDVNDSANRVSATCDAAGNRSSVTLNP